MLGGGDGEKAPAAVIAAASATIAVTVQRREPALRSQKTSSPKDASASSTTSASGWLSQRSRPKDGPPGVMGNCGGCTSTSSSQCENTVRATTIAAREN